MEKWFERVDVVDQISGVRVVAWPVLAVGGRIATESEDVLDARLAVLLEQLDDLAAGVATAREVGHRRDRGLAAHPRDDLTRALAGTAPCAVGDRHEARRKWLELGDGAPERQLGAIGLRREELE